MKLEKLQAGLTVFEVRRIRGGIATYQIRIVSVNPEARTVLASWNNNSPREFRERSWAKWRLVAPLMVPCGFGYRLATREEAARVRALEQEAKP